MKYTIALLAVMCGCALAADVVPIISQESTHNEDGSYHYKYETGDGVKASQDGQLKKIDAETSVEVISGQYEYPGEDGKPVVVSYIADENGYQPTGESIPKVPDHVVRLLKYIAEHPQPVEKKL